MYELDCYIMLIRSTDFNPFRLAAAYALCSPPSPASGDGFHKVSALSRGIKFHERMRVRNSPLELLERVASTKHVSAAASRVSQKFVSDEKAMSKTHCLL